MDVLVICQVLHPTGYLQTHHHQSLTNFHHLHKEASKLLSCNCQTIMLIYLIFIGFIYYHDIVSLSSEVFQKAPIGHIGHDNVGGGASIKTDSNETHNVGMFEPTHLQTLLHKLFHIYLVKITCSVGVLILQKSSKCYLSVFLQPLLFLRTRIWPYRPPRTLLDVMQCFYQRANVKHVPSPMQSSSNTSWLLMRNFPLESFLIWQLWTLIPALRVCSELKGLFTGQTC